MSYTQLSTSQLIDNVLIQERYMYRKCILFFMELHFPLGIHLYTLSLTVTIGYCLLPTSGENKIQEGVITANNCNYCFHYTGMVWRKKNCWPNSKKNLLKVKVSTIWLCYLPCILVCTQTSDAAVTWTTSNAGVIRRVGTLTSRQIHLKIYPNFCITLNQPGLLHLAIYDTGMIH